MKHVVVYVPGLGDARVLGRKLLVASWFLYGVRPVVHQLNWGDGESFQPKLDRLLIHIDGLVAAGKRVSLVGESAGGSAVMHAYALRPDSIHRVACICAKLRGVDSVSPVTYGRNPAFGEAMQSLAASVANVSADKRRRIRSVHSLADRSVPLADSQLPGVESRTIPTWSHISGIVLGDTLFGWLLVGFLRRH